MIGQIRTKRATFRGSPLFQATYKNSNNNCPIKKRSLYLSCVLDLSVFMLYVAWKNRTSSKIRKFCPVLSNSKAISVTSCVFCAKYVHFEDFLFMWKGRVLRHKVWKYHLFSDQNYAKLFSENSWAPDILFTSSEYVIIKCFRRWCLLTHFFKSSITMCTQSYLSSPWHSIFWELLNVSVRAAKSNQPLERPVASACALLWTGRAARASTAPNC